MRRSTFRRHITALSAVAILIAIAAVAAPSAQAAPYPEYPYDATDYNEPIRGQFHFSSQGGWMNDVNAPLYYNGVYHLFYQHNPHGVYWDTMHWGHATSRDLVHWTQQPIALEPSLHNATLFSGGGWVDHNNVTGLKTGTDAPILLFTNTDGVSIAYSTDGARTFRMHNGGAKVISTPYESRDPKVIWDAARNRWSMVFWGNEGGNVAKFYSSTNLLDWTYRGEFRADWLFECPDLYQLPVDGNTSNPKWVLQDASGEYVIGTLNSAGVFVADPGWSRPQRMDMGRTAFDGTAYAGLTFTNMPDNRVVQMFWQPGNKGATWTGNASFPARLGLRTFPGEGIRVTRNPVSEISTIRQPSQTWSNLTISNDLATNPFNGIAADTYEIEATYNLTGATATDFGFELHRRADGTRDAAIGYDRVRQTLADAPMPPVDNRVKLRVLVDRGQLETFGNDGKVSVTDNVDFDSSSHSLGIRTYANNGTVRIESLTFRRLGKAWTNAPSGPDQGVGMIKHNGADKCVDRDNATAVVQVWDCWNSANQRWTFTAAGKIKIGDECLDQPGETIGNGAKLKTHPCWGGDNQRWIRIGANQYQNSWSKRCLDLEAGNATNGRQLQVWDCVGGPNQSWSMPA
ncbi:sucrose-6-phosphate hydrolase SacC (GH32 family) [Saccharothrix ecbatanensis]|uniref:Sucrose-6-phosphate hydrolase SacC (GH32 family) n=1 Tax=Saccharothrix ecbatanensis TaxID=1105145 RepID=A0A7W9LY38_9PSEU|nr:ricin-type beta-trefoil lectin domain protein [Saccharothrix ecbatanensis]MBB5800308.1 sucrose-6-phosphate hydrolase SacC (GH32 family) [Saccharothrix ecbatanensis]